MNRSFAQRWILLTAMAALACWAVSSLPAAAQQRDVFDKAHEAKFDPFSVLNQAPPVELKGNGKEPGPAKKQDHPQAKDAPKNPKGVEDLIDFEVTVSPKEAKRGEIVRVKVTGVPRRGYHTYSMTKVTPYQSGVQISTFKILPGAVVRPLPPIEESEPDLFVETGLAGQPSFYEHFGPFTWSFDVLVPADAKVGASELPFSVALQVCSTGCTPGKITLKANFVIAAGDPVGIPADVKSRSEQIFPPSPQVVTPDGSPAKAKPLAETPVWAQSGFVPHDYDGSLEKLKKQIVAPEVKPHEGLLMFMLTGMFWGFISLITPCVFPMIPITVSFFLKQSEKEHHKPVTMALVYCGTIILVLTIAAAALLNFFRVLSISPLMNFGLGLLFIFFALSLFGMYEIELPSFLARYTSERESKGGMVGTIFMALTFTIISFACVAPFLGGFGGTADTVARPFWHTILGGLAFSVTFASPFFILALFPTLLKAMPKSGAWLNSVKVVMGFLELAAALKFFRAGELVMSSPLGLFTFDLVLGLWIAICLLCGLYLLGVYRLPHDSPAESLSVPRLLFAFAFLGLGFYLLPALITKPVEGEQPRPNGEVFAWVNSFLLPDARPNKGEVWSPNLEDAVAQASEYRKRTGKAKLIFIDFTGEVCTNCRLNEQNVFTKSEIQQLLKPYSLVKLYCDAIPLVYYAPEDRAAAAAGRRGIDAKTNFDFQAKIFNGVELPLYVILEPLADGTIKVVAKYDKGLIRSDAEFAAFLRQPQEAVGATVASR